MSATLVPSFQLTPALVLTLKQQTIEQTMQVARSAMGASQNLVFREAVANDLNPNATSTNTNARLVSPALTALVFATAFSQALPNNVAVGIYGYSALIPNPQNDVIRISLGVNAVPLAQIPLDELYTYPQTTGYFSVPIIFAPLDTITVSLLSHNGQAASTEFYNLLAYIVEPKSRTVAPADVGAGIGEAR